MMFITRCDKCGTEISAISVKWLEDKLEGYGWVMINKEDDKPTSDINKAHEIYCDHCIMESKLYG